MAMKKSKGRIRDLFESLEQLRHFCRGEWQIRWGFDTVEDLWAANPEVEFE